MIFPITAFGVEYPTREMFVPAAAAAVTTRAATAATSAIVFWALFIGMLNK
jgi:hypothetical protein